MSDHKIPNKLPIETNSNSSNKQSVMTILEKAQDFTAIASAQNQYQKLIQSALLKVKK